MKRMVGALVMAGAMLLSTGPAQADHRVGEGHWSNFEWKGSYAENSVQGRQVFVYDRTGNSLVWQAAQQVQADFRYDLDARGWSGIVPVVYFVHDPGNAGACDPFFGLQGYSFATMCMTSGTGGVTQVWHGHMGEAGSGHPAIYIGSGNTRYEAVYNVLYHEMLHMVGLFEGPCGANTDHSCDPANLMYPTVPYDRIKRPSGHDYDAMWAFYGPHPIYS